MVYAIFEDFFPEIEKKLIRVAKKCAKHGNEFIFKVTGEEIREVTDEQTKEVSYYKFILIDVEGTARIDDWECIAILEIHKNGNIIRKINTDIAMPNRFKNSENICEHCNSHRDNRKNLYVIHNVKTDEWKQVGGNCLSLYTNGLSMEYVVSFIDGITELEEYNGFSSFGYGKKYYKVDRILAYAVEVIEKMGYFNSQSDVSTKSLVGNLVSDNLNYSIIDCNNILKTGKMSIRLSTNDFLKPNTDNTVRKIIDYYMSLEDDSEFIHNVQLLLREGYATYSNFGFLCYLPQGYAKHIQQEAERVKRLTENQRCEYFGEVGKRYKDIKVSHAERLTSWETAYGWMNIYKIVLTSGEILTWKTSNDLFDCMFEEKYYDVNGEYREWISEDQEDDHKGHWECRYITIDSITFTVKEHKTYNEQKQTEVTRCKLNYKKVEE